MDSLFATLLHATAQMMVYADPEMPDIRPVTHEELQTLMCAKVAGPCQVPTAVYFGHHIFYDKAINLQSEYGKSIIVHEMAHYLQDLHGWGQTDCPNMHNREAHAYMIQMYYLKSRAIETDVEAITSWRPSACSDTEAIK